MNQSRMTHVTESDEVGSEKESSVSEERKCTSRDRDTPHQMRSGWEQELFFTRYSDLSTSVRSL